MKRQKTQIHWGLWGKGEKKKWKKKHGVYDCRKGHGRKKKGIRRDNGKKRGGQDKA